MNKKKNGEKNKFKMDILYLWIKKMCWKPNITKQRNDKNQSY